VGQGLADLLLAHERNGEDDAATEPRYSPIYVLIDALLLTDLSTGVCYRNILMEGVLLSGCAEGFIPLCSDGAKE
jgi:hypothetical protein